KRSEWKAVDPSCTLGTLVVYANRCQHPQWQFQHVQPNPCIVRYESIALSGFGKRNRASDQGVP
ncbi:MAG: hypothetical protein ACKN9S_17545, partial [Pirellula sp.]